MSGREKRERDAIAKQRDEIGDGLTKVMLERNHLTAVIEAVEALADEFRKEGDRHCADTRDVYEATTIASAARRLRAALASASSEDGAKGMSLPFQCQRTSDCLCPSESQPNEGCYAPGDAASEDGAE